MAMSRLLKGMIALFLCIWVVIILHMSAATKEIHIRDPWRSFRMPSMKVWPARETEKDELITPIQGVVGKGDMQDSGNGDDQRTQMEEAQQTWEVRGSRLRAVFATRKAPKAVKGIATQAEWQSFEVLDAAGQGKAHLEVTSIPLFELLTSSVRSVAATAFYACTVKAAQQTSPLSLLLELGCLHGISAEFSVKLTHEDDHYMRFAVKIWSEAEDSWPKSLGVLRLWRCHGKTAVAETHAAKLEEDNLEEINGLPVLLNRRFFAAVEHPMAVNTAEKIAGRLWHSPAGQIEFLDKLPRPTKESPWQYGFVLGTFDEESQARRSFLAYLHKERPGRRSPMVHYNSWYDFYSYQDEGFNGGFKDPNPDPTKIATLRPDKMDEGGCMKRVEAFAHELAEKRNTKLDSFLWDDGWDDPHTLWEFDKERFPHGFEKVAEKAKTFGAGTGVWLSPWGGYGFPQENRVKYGKEQGYETNINRNIGAEAFSLAGPKYRQAFEQTALKFRREQGVNMFKFDGVAGDPAELATEMEAMLRLMTALRTRTRTEEKNESKSDSDDDVWINLTTGTWPSPFFLLWADSIWRGGSDIPVRPRDWLGITGALRSYDQDKYRIGLDGMTRRQRWIRWRGMVVYILVVKRSLFFPISQLMIHGVIVASHGDALHWGLDRFDIIDFTQEVWSFVALGLQLQELYVASRHMTSEAWDILAEGLKWSRQEAAVLRDSHWAFGNVAEYEVYCVASWDVEARRGFMLFHNPTGALTSSKLFTLRQVLELPTNQDKSVLSVSLVKSAFREEQAEKLMQWQKRLSTLPRLPGWNCSALFTEASRAQDMPCRLPVSAEVSIGLKPTEVLVLSVTWEQD